MREATGTSAKNGDLAWVRLEVDEGRIVRADGEGPDVAELLRATIGLPILEAAEAGTPVVVDGDARVANEVVGRHCFRVSGSSVEVWVAELRRAVASAPIPDALDLPDWAAVARMYRSLYAEVSER